MSDATLFEYYNGTERGWAIRPFSPTLPRAKSLPTAWRTASQRDQPRQEPRVRLPPTGESLLRLCTEEPVPYGQPVTVEVRLPRAAISELRKPTGPTSDPKRDKKAAFLIALDTEMLRRRALVAGPSLSLQQAARRRLMAQGAQCAPRVRLSQELAHVQVRLEPEEVPGRESIVFLQVVVEAAIDSLHWVHFGQLLPVRVSPPARENSVGQATSSLEQSPTAAEQDTSGLLRACCLLWGLLVVLLGAGGGSAFGLAARHWLGVGRPTAKATGSQTARAAGGLEITQAALEAVEAASSHVSSGLDSSALLAFADQGQNINGLLFQGSLPAYLAFLYFLGWRGNKTPPLVQFGFAFLLLFVVATIPTGIISKSTYGVILADSDWLHGTAESLLTCTNIMLVLGFRAALQGDASMADSSAVRAVAGVWLAAVVLTLASGIPLFGWEVHTPFLAGLGALPPDMLASPEPANALSIPNWMVHFSTVFEFLVAMTLAWRYAEVTGNERWKGLSWGMLPSHCSSVAALTFHVFYNGVPWILTAQAAFTFLGNLSLAVAALRIAVSNGWSVQELNPLPVISGAFSRLLGGKAEEEKESESATFDTSSLTPLAPDQLTPGPLLAVELVLVTVAASYATKYGELALAPSLFESNDLASTVAALVILVTPPVLVLSALLSRSPDLREGKFPAFLALAKATGDS